MPKAKKAKVSKVSETLATVSSIPTCLSAGETLTGKGRPDPPIPTKWKPVQTKTPFRRIRNGLASGKIFVGLDVSLSSPGLTVMDSQTREATIYFLTPDRKAFKSGATHLMTSGEFAGWKITTVCLDRPIWSKSENFKERCTRYAEMVQLLLNPVLCLDPARTVVGIEHYAYSASTTSAYTKLMEMGGHMRVTLCQKGFQTYEFSPSYVKRIFTNSGKASKHEMCDRMVDDLGMDLFSWIGVDVRSNKSLGPVDDMVDSFAVALSAAIQ